MPRPPKHLHTKKHPEKPSKPVKEERWKKFIDTRKGKGKEESLELLRFILEKEEEYDGKGVPYVVIVEHMKQKFRISRSRLNQLMEDLEAEGIVTRNVERDSSQDTSNKNRLYYKCSGQAITDVLTVNGLKKEVYRLYKNNVELSNRLNLAIRILDKHDNLEEYEDALKQRDLELQQRRSQTRVDVISKLLNMTPEEYKQRANSIERSRKAYLRRDLEKMKNGSDNHQT
jgi:hypothetical protein